MLAGSLSQSQLWRVVDGLRGMLGAPGADSGVRSPKSTGYGRRRCKECEGICELLRWGEVQRRRHGGCYSGSSESRVLHNSYRELDRSASLSGCDTCRLLRRAFLLEQITGQGADLLDLAGNQAPIHAVLDIKSREITQLRLSIHATKAGPFSATIRVTDQPQQTPLDSARRPPSLRSDVAKLRRVIEDCGHNHQCRSNYRWSGRNPTWLLKILPDGRVQLIEGPRVPVDYVVLSYSWGDKESMPPAEWARIKAAGTKTIQGLPVPERLHPFMLWELPETMQDAVEIAASLGFFYIWIDSVCIPKGTNWDTEASLMHEVYGNAIFTLVASSSSKATDHLLHDRLAWAHRSKPCKLRDCWWLYNTQIPLDRVRFESPVAQRGWTLQEERLSPRILYWTGQRWYWSCAERQVAELVHSECHSESPVAANEAPQSSPQRLLKLCHTGNIRQLHEEWLDIVEAYTCRDLVEPRDRFLAIAGLAVRFYTAISGSGETSGSGDYLAGLWKDDFARHLGWSVASAVHPRQHLQHVAPSWSWASLPLRVHTKTKHPFKPSAHFELIAATPVGASHSAPVTENSGGGSSPRPGASPIERGRAVEEQGRAIKFVEVQGRFRYLVPDNSREVSWDAIQPLGTDDRPRFDFTNFPGQSLYSRNKTDGRILSKTAHHGEVVGQLDYLVASDGDESAEHPNACCVREGTERDIVCLELGELTMLLMVLDRKPGQPEAYKRVGVAIGYGEIVGFFNGCETKRVCLA